MPFQSVRSHHPDPQRQRLYRRAIAIAIGGNVLLAVAKGMAAWSVDSSAILSDAANSFSDTLYSLMMAVGLFLSQRPADESHPQGHSRFEPLVAVFIAVAMGAAGVGALRAAGLRMITGTTAVMPGWPMGVLVGCALLTLPPLEGGGVLGGPFSGRKPLPGRSPLHGRLDWVLPSRSG